MKNRLDCILWCPDVEVDKGRFKQSHYLGVLYIGRFAQANGYSVRIIRCGHDVEAVAAEVRENGARTVGISVSAGMWRSNLKLATRLCARLKRTDPGARTVLGGIIPTMFAEDILGKFRDVDVIVRGEGELPFLEILKGTPLDAIPGIAYRTQDASVTLTAARQRPVDLDAMPYALAVETEDTATTELGGLLGSVRYEVPRRSASIITSRGCNGACTFCLNPWYYAPVRTRSIGNVVDEIRELSARGVRFLRICDANFVLDADRVMEFCEAVSPFGMAWSCWQRADVVDPRVYRAMKRAGCKVTTLGVESFDEDIRNRVYRKGVSQEQLYAAVRYASQAGLDVSAELILGCPQENPNRIRSGLERAKGILKYIDYINISFLKIVPKTVLWNRLTRDLRPEIQRRLWLRSMFQPVSICRVTSEFTEDDLRRWADEYVRSVCRNRAYLLRQGVRMLTRRKRLLWINRGNVVRRISGKLARSIRGKKSRREAAATA